MTTSEITSLLKTLIQSKVELAGGSISHQFLDQIKTESLAMLKMINPGIDLMDTQTVDALYRTARNEYLSVNPVNIDPSSTLRDPKLKEWLTDERKKDLPTDYISRYITYLRTGGKSESVVKEIAGSSERILGNLGDPKSTADFYVKGLVVGSVQSGKTGNFNAVINRAIDAGYGLIIILSGIMEDLRSQTQLRIESDVVGEGTIDISTDSKGDKGVAKIHKFGEQGDNNIRQVNAITSYKSDFVRTVKESDFSLNNKNILICKKNTGVLKNLLIWLNDYLNENKEKHSIPLLIIDDEADNASLNNLGHLGREYASTINGHIRALLSLFTRKTYLGYTATPFANVLQDRNEEATGKWKISYKSGGNVITKEFGQVNNIFPDDFIELLNPPSNYIGAKQIFETSLDTDIKKIPLVVVIPDFNQAFPARLVETADGTVRAATEKDHEDETETRAAKSTDEFPKALPESLEEAIRCFILTIALRMSRKPEMIGSVLYMPHHTMLVHVSRFILWQNRTKELIVSYVEKTESQIQNDLPSAPDSIYGKLEQTWNKNYANIVTNIRSYLPDDYQDEFLVTKTFNEIKPYLIEAVKGIDIKAINSVTKDRLLYNTDAAKNGKKYIAIGGNRLSRGFTLEGLTINYFIRDTHFADTLLQMGRWFGYRLGYLDCCKLFTSRDAVEKFDLTTRTIEELEYEFKKMERQKKTPNEFILRVRKHPGALKVTRPAILKNTEEVNWSYQDKIEQTTTFRLDPGTLKKSWEELTSLFSKYDSVITETDKKDFFLIRTDEKGLFDFLDISNSFHEFETENIKTFVKKCVSSGKLKDWVIAVKKHGDARELIPSYTRLPGKITMSVRMGPKKAFADYRSRFKDSGLFYASGKSSNIITSGSDLSVLLSESEIRKAQEEFLAERKVYYIKDKGLSEDEALRKLSKITFPERIYRERIPETTGLLIVYIIDLKPVFRQTTKGEFDGDLKKHADKKGFDLDVPLFGYAIGFPPINPDPGGVYLKTKEDLTEVDTEEFDPELNSEE